MSDKKEVQISDVPESYQMYLKKIYILSKRTRGGWVSNKDLAESLNVEPPSISEMLHKLKHKDLINWKPRKSIRLTKKGKQIATQLTETDSLLRVFFGEVLKIEDKALVEKISCEIEHHFTRQVKEALKDFLSNYFS
mgnify:CR=1 FL=1